MKPLTLSAAALLLSAQIATAQQGQPGAHFVEMWDLDGDGAVTLAEATERRSDIFFSFDADDNGALNAEEYDQFDAARAADMAENGAAHGQGKGQAKRLQRGLVRGFNDVDGDGAITLEEFLSKTAAWVKQMDHDGDGAISTSDFGPKG